MNQEDLYLSLRVEKAEVFLDHEDPGNFLHPIQGEILGYDEADRQRKLGRFRVFQVDLDGGLEVGFGPLDVLDGRQETSVFMPLFSARGEGFSNAVMRLCHDDLLYQNLLVIDRVEILPRYRGQGLGAQVVKGLIWKFRQGAGLAVLKAFPLQFEYLHEHPGTEVELWRRKMGLDGLPKDEVKATRRLKAFYADLGFMPIPRTSLMIANLGWKLP
jgi:GNAT superfamily N-acetyltransferase